MNYSTAAASALVLLLSPLSAMAIDPFGTMSLEEWLAWEKGAVQQRLEANLSPSGTKPGVVVASPQRDNPDYFFHWVRDGALVMEAIREGTLRGDSSKVDREQYLRDYAYFSRSNQLTHTLTGLGEPKFLVSGDAYNAPWGRPQNDGPALRALTLTRWAHQLLDRGDSHFVRSWLFDSAKGNSTLIQQDLNYVADHWHEPSFDLWEEEKADHFFTRLVQAQALTEGAALADRLGDSSSAVRYRTEAKFLGDDLQLFWNPARGQIDVSRNHREGLDYKNSQLDMAVILGVLRSGSSLFSVQDPRVGATFTKIVSAFSALYSINQRKEAPGVALGRYAEDRYSGSSFDKGNPWVLTTLAAAEYYYRLAKLRSSRDLLETGDLYFSRVKYHANGDGSLSEQMNRDTGFMTSARDLTWNYAAFFTALWSREDAIKSVRKTNRHTAADSNPQPQML